MKLKDSPWKVKLLAGLLIGAAVLFYFNVLSGGPESTPRVSVGSPPPVPLTASGRPVAQTDHRRAPGNNGISEFKPRQGYARPEDKPDPATIDPELHLDLLAKVQSVEPEASFRNVFQYGAAPPPPKPVELPKSVPKIAINDKPAGPTAPPGPPPPPQAPPMTFKYYGYKVSKSDGHKQAFLLDGDDIIIAGENDAMKAGRYKVIRIGVNSITIEDMQFKSEQTLRLQEDAVA
jgi:hypothetical protein